ncbi:hypothetical protein QWJ34_16025 [Saccharibacillus sp. CPCC 101409]|uniref:hypothetical protein n=1 Tax=Saccharibacillus sp. CPCC 101409 TaxID=3058041 RepID=UPI00267253C6|nr:hypothetical protein [Saccharibacillus sp. CPCC 101409]MDO3411274.1 hypothetical protein [Saccharibacillus sp. CPCC 101409]
MHLWASSEDWIGESRQAGRTVLITGGAENAEQAQRVRSEMRETFAGGAGQDFNGYFYPPS